MKPAVSSYAFVNAKLRGRLSRLVSRELLTEMAESRSLEEAVRFLEKTAYESVVRVYSETGDILLAELEIERINRAGLNDMRRYVAQFGRDDAADFVDALLLRFEIWAIKNAIRLWYEHRIRGRSIEGKISYLIRSDGADLEEIVNAPDTETIIALIEKRPFSAVLGRELPSVEEKHSIFDLEISLDRWYYRTLREAASRLHGRDRSIAERLVGMEIDTINVNWIVRLHAFYRSGTERALPQAEILSGGSIIDKGLIRTAMESQNPAGALSQAIGTRIGAGSPDESAEHEDTSVRSLAFLESLLQQMLVYESRRILGGYPFTIGIVLAYFLLSRQEARSLTTVLNGKFYQLSSDQFGGLL